MFEEGPRRNSFGLAQHSIAVAEFAVASPRDHPDKMLLGQDALEYAK